MGETLAAALVALVTAVLVALWNTGGRAAVERRTIKQEIELAHALADGPERRALERLVHERATLYVLRRSHRPLSPRTRRRLVAATVAVPPALALLAVAWGPTSGAVSFSIWIALNLLLAVGGSLVGFWASRGVRAWLAKGRREDLQAAHTLLRREE